MQNNTTFQNKFSIYHMKTALLYSNLSKAERLKCGSVLVTEDNTRIIMIGYNGTPSGADNKCEYLDNDSLKTKIDVIHAEANVILYCAKHGISTNGCNLYITHSPCVECAKLIICSGIKKIFYNKEYRLNDGLNLLKKYNLEIIKMDLKESN